MSRCFALGPLVGGAMLMVAVAAHTRPAPTAAGFVPELDALVSELMADFGAKGVAVALVDDGKVAVTRYYGFADAEKKIPVSSTTVFQPASVAKSMTAAGIMRLAQDGKVSLDDPLFKHVTRWRPPPSEFPLDQVTIGRVLSHTSGLSRWTTGIWTVEDRLPMLAAALSGDNPERESTLLAFAPGTKFSYSGAGYSLLQFLVEETTGQPFPAYMETHVLKPMGLTGSSIGWPASGLPNETRTYDEFGKILSNYRTVELGAGGWNTTLPDLAKYTASFAKVNWGKGPLTAKSVETMMTPARNAKVSDRTTAGYGLFIEEFADVRKLVGHTGGNPGVGALFTIDPDSGDGIAILVNRSWGHHVYMPIACAWRNYNRPAGADAEDCPRNPTGIIMHAVASAGLAAGKARFDTLYAAKPGDLAVQQMSGMVGNFIGSKRYSDAVAVVRWHPEHSRSAALQEQLGDALLGLGDAAGARAAWSESLRLEPGRTSVQEKLKSPSATSG